MKVRKHQSFLWISFALFALSFIIFLVKIAVLYNEFKATSSTLSPSEYAFGIDLFAYLFFGTPVLLMELSCIRSVYKLLKYEPSGKVKVCYIISAIIALVAFVFQCLIFFDAIDFSYGPGKVKLQENVLLLTGWPVILVSFILGSIPMNRTEDTANQDSNFGISSN